MLTLGRITRQADQEGVDSDVVERDYVLTHIITSLALHPDSALLQFKGGTALRLCHFADYRYSADIDLNSADGTTDAEIVDLLKEVVVEARERLGLPLLELKGDPPEAIDFIGPKLKQRPQSIKLDITTDELVSDPTATSILLRRYEDQPDSPALRTYSLAETTSEKLRSMIQRLQCRDLYDTWFILEHSDVDIGLVRPDFEAKARHRDINPSRFPQRIEERLGQYGERWSREMSRYMAHPPDFEKIARETSRKLRQAGYL